MADDTFDLEAVKATFPWQEQVMHSPVGGLVRMVDRNGNEVPLFTMTKFLMVITNHMAAKAV